VQAERHFRASVALWQQLGDPDGTARALGSLGFLAQARGDHAQAIAHLERSLPLLAASTDRPARARVLTGLAVSTLAVGDLERAVTV
jgi:hypothetical protein